MPSKTASKPLNWSGIKRFKTCAKCRSQTSV